MTLLSGYNGLELYQFSSISNCSMSLKSSKVINSNDWNVNIKFVYELNFLLIVLTYLIKFKYFESIFLRIIWLHQDSFIKIVYLHIQKSVYCYVE